MKRGTAVCLVLVASLCASWAQLPPNAFLVRPAKNVAEFIRQVQTGPVVMDRFVRHFQMTPDEILAMLRGLRQTRLKEATYFLVFNVPADTGEITSRRLLLRKGTRVLVNADGVPVIQVSCGNPLLRTDEASAPAIPAEVSVPSGLQEFAAPEAGVTAPFIEMLPTEPIAMIAPDVSFVTPPPIESIISVGEVAEAPFAVGPLAFLPTLLIGLNPGSEVIPEPGTMIALSAGLAMLAGRRLRRRSR